MLDNEDDELRVAGYNQLCTVFKRIIADQTSDVKQAYLDAAAEMQLNPTERNRNHYNETKELIINARSMPCIFFDSLCTMNRNKDQLH